MKFVQIIDYVTTRPDEIETLGEKLRAERGDETGGPRVTITKDRDRENHYLVIAEFESYDVAMQNSNDPRTQEFAGRMAELTDGAPTFYNLDVIREGS